MHITRGFDIHNSLIAGLLLAYLLYFRRRFNTISDPTSVKQALITIPFLLGAVFLYGYVGLHHMYDHYHWPLGSSILSEAFRAGILIFEPQIAATTRHASMFLNSIQIGGWLARLYIVILLLRPVILRHREEAPSEQIRTIFATHGDQSLAAFSIQEDKHHLVLCDGRALIGYAVRSHVALACGDPLTSDVNFNDAVRQYILHCQKHGWTPCIYEATESRLAAYQNLHLRSLKMAEEAVLDLTEFSLAGGKRATLRAMVHKTAKLGFTLRQYVRQEEPDPAIDEQLQEISDEWLREKRLGELGFTMGSFSLENVTHIPLFLCLNGEQVEAFCSWLPYRNGRAVVLDLMRKRQSAISGTMDFLLSQSLLSLREQGFVEASLANAPLANVEKPRGGLERGVALLFENMNGIYGYKNLFQFKKKFAPRWEGRYLIYPKGADLPKVALALTSLHTSGNYAELMLKRP
jgi:phosphatidylglycerol lysyltransferase